MRKTIPIIALILALSAVSVHALVASGPSLNASLLYYQPVPATPGSLLDVYVQISNQGDTASNVRVEFVDNNPFSIDTQADRIKSIDSVPGQQSFLLKYKVRVSPDAQPGTNYLKISYSTSSTSAQTALLPIDVYSNTLSLTIENISLDPAVFTPGGIGKLGVTIRNNAGVKVSSGTVRLDLSGLNIVPVGTTNQQRFTDLQANDVRTFSFDLSPSPDLVPGVYQIPILTNFTDQQGKQYQISEVVGITVGATPDISVTIDDSKVTGDQRTGDVIIRVTNKGLGEVKFVDITLGNSSSYELLSGSPEKYIGNIDSDDYKTARVTLTASGDTLTIPVTVTYMDALNTQYKKDVTLSIPLYTTKSGGISGMTIFVVIVILAVIGYIVYRRKRAKR